MHEIHEPNKWRTVLERAASKGFKLGDVFFWPEQDHHFVYVGPCNEDGSSVFFIMGSGQDYNRRKGNFIIEPGDFKGTAIETQRRAFREDTYFLFRQYLQYQYSKLKLHDLYTSGLLEYKFSMKLHLPQTYKRLEKLIKDNFPQIYIERIFQDNNIPE